MKNPKKLNAPSLIIVCWKFVHYVFHVEYALVAAASILVTIFKPESSFPYF